MAKSKMYVELVEQNVDGCGTDISIMLEVKRDAPISPVMMKSHMQNAIDMYKDENPGEWDTDGCFDAAIKRLQDHGYKVKIVTPTISLKF